MSGNKVILYSYFESSCAWRVRNVLNLKKIDYEIRPISLASSLDSGYQHSEEYLSINPMGFVPALFIDGVTLIESVNIMHYLEETRTEIPLMPTDPIARARVREICEVIATGIQPMQNTHATCNVEESKRAEWIRFYITKGFKALERLLSKSSKKYCVGDKMTLADCCLAPQVYNSRKYGVDISEFPNIIRIDKTLQENPAIRAGHPKNQPDYNKKDFL